MRCKVLAVAAVVMACMVSPALAQNPSVTYQYTSDATSYASGSVVSVYLTETLYGGAKSIIGPGGQEYGVVTDNVSINYTGASGAVSITAATLNNQAFTAGFGGPSGGSNAGGTYISSGSGAVGTIYDSVPAGSSPTTGALAVQVSNTGVGESQVVVNQLLLGTFTITNTSGANAVFQITDGTNDGSTGYDEQLNAGSTTTTENALQLDQDGDTVASTGNDAGATLSWNGTEDIANTFTVLTASAGVPEPSSMLLCGLAISGVGVRAWRRRRGQATETEPEPATAV
jgi:hypothetical protein